MKLYKELGYISSILFSIMLIPQLYKLYKNQSTDGISISFMTIFMVASIMMFYYGYKLKSIPVMINNGTNFIFTSIIIVLYFYHDIV